MTLVAMNLAAVINLAALPVEAEYGFSSAFYYLLAAIVFLVPVSLVAAELASIFKDKQGGVFRWISEAFGPRWGLLGIWMNWLMSIMWYPTVLTFASVAIAFIGVNQQADMRWAANKIYIACVLISIFWLATFLVSKGPAWISRITKAGVMIGTIIPGVVLILVSVCYIVSGGKSYLDFSEPFIPDFSNFNTLVLASSIFLYFGGMELSSVHVKNISDPQKNYPRAIFISAAASVIIFILGTWAISVVLPQDKMNLTQGLLLSFHAYFTWFKVPWISPVISIALIIGVITGVLTWINGPSKALLAVARAGYLPRFFQKLNKNGIQINILLAQGAVVTLVNLLFIIVPSVQAFYQILAQLSAVMYLIMYMLMFLSAVNLRLTMPEAERTFRIGKKGNAPLFIVAGVGFLGVFTAFVLSFIPPEQISTGNPAGWYAVLAGSTVAAFIIPLVLYSFRKKSWQNPALSAEDRFKPFFKEKYNV